MASIGAANKIPDGADPTALLAAATEQVKAIINQPVTTFPLNSVTGNIATYDTWFHPGAIKPDFDTVDVRKTQDTSEYSKSDYITSKLNPGVAFPGKEVEFNAMTKYFYTDRSLPKKKLTGAEMLEINRLYRRSSASAKRSRARRRKRRKMAPRRKWKRRQIMCPKTER